VSRSIMRTVKDSCIEFLKNEDIRKDIKDIVRPIIQLCYNEIYVYIWCICFYNVVFISIVLLNLFLLIRLLSQIAANQRTTIHIE